ncbi:MAG TPA: regulatory iron-sulfur-containing complex subunit RicT [Thermomicrobiales bacterium]|nr:regulatory iron-sulfur-containing complex subunit RicT [Thermomicrobiales bacterium]
MADFSNSGLTAAWPGLPASRDEARALARERFKARLQAGEPVGQCGCHDEQAALGPASAGEPAERVAGVRFRDSGQTYYFRAGGLELAAGDWVVVETGRGREAGRVVLAPQQVRLSLLQGDLHPIQRKMDDGDVRRMDEYRRGSSHAVRAFGARARAKGMPIKPISAEFSFDGSALVLNYSTPDRDRHVDGAALRALAREMAAEFETRVELRQVGPRDEARLLGGVGRCGRTLCCASWLPVYPEISMNMAKAQDLPLNPTKVSGVCGRLLCCLSYENEQYKQMKAILPRLGQTVETPAGAAQVVGLQLLKELVTVRTPDGVEAVFSSAELGLRAPAAEVAAPALPAPVVRTLETTLETAAAEPQPEPEAPADEATPAASRRRRRRRGARRHE